MWRLGATRILALEFLRSRAEENQLILNFRSLLIDRLLLITKQKHKIISKVKVKKKNKINIKIQHFHHFFFLWEKPRFIFKIWNQKFYLLSYKFES